MTDSSFQIKCPRCHTTIAVSADRAGQSVQCTQCQHSMLVPGTRSTSSDVSVEDLISFDDEHSDHLEEAEAASESATDSPPDEEPNVVSADDPVAADEDDESAVEVLHEESDDDLDDLLPLREPTSAADSTASEDPRNEGKDPFEVDKDAPLRFEGITPHDNTFSTPCPLCGSLVYASPSQIGQRLRCHDCHTMVEIAERKKDSRKAKPPSYELTFSTGDDADEYRLSDPVDKPVVDTRIDPSEHEIDYDDAAFFENRRNSLDELPEEFNEEAKDSSLSLDVDNLQDQPSLNASNSAPADAGPGDDAGETGMVAAPEDDSGEYGLAPPDEDMLKPSAHASTISPEAYGSGTDEEQIVHPVPRPDYDELSKRSERRIPAPPPAPAPHAPPPPPPRDPASRRKRFRDPDETDQVPDTKTAKDRPMTVTPTDETAEDIDKWHDMGDWLKESLQNLGNKEFWVRGFFCGIALAVAYCMILLGSGFLGEGSNALQKFAGYLFIALGQVPLILTAAYLCIVAGVLVKSRLSQTEGEVWSEFSLSDWMSDILYIGTSAVLAILPGLLLGLMASPRNIVGGAFFAILTFYFLTPVLISAVAFNGTPYGLFSNKVVQSFSTLPNRWIRFAVLAAILTVITTITIAIAVYGGILGAIIAAFAQIALILFYFDRLGNHARSIIENIVARAASS